MRLRPRRRTLVVCSSSAVPAEASRRRPGRARRIRRWLRIGALLAVLGVLRLARGTRARWEPVCLAAGVLLTVVGFVVPAAAAAFVAGLLVLIVTLVKGIAKHGRDAGISRRWR